MRAARDHSDVLSVRCHRGSVARDAAGLRLETDERAARPFCLDPAQLFAADEFALAELDRPPEARFVGVDGLVHLVAIKPQGGLETSRIPSAQPTGQNAG